MPAELSIDLFSPDQVSSGGRGSPLPVLLISVPVLINREAVTGNSSGLLRYATARPSIVIRHGHVASRDVGLAESEF